LCKKVPPEPPSKNSIRLSAGQLPPAAEAARRKEHKSLLQRLRGRLLANRLPQILRLKVSNHIRGAVHLLQPGGGVAKVKGKLLSIRVRYCGGCNPEIDRGSLVSRLQVIIREGGAQAVLSGHGEGDWLLLVNGCPRACLEEGFSEDLNARRLISVEGAHLDRRPVAEQTLAQAIWERIKHSYDRL